MVSADLHIHSNYSPDSNIDIKKLINQAKKKKIDIICITDHNIFEESCALDYFISKHTKPLIIKGVELTTNNGDLLIFGLKNNFWNDYKIGIHPDINTVLKDLNTMGAVAIWAHPFRSYCKYCYNTNYTDYKEIKIMETLNGRNSNSENTDASNYAKLNNYKITGGSDAHTTQHVASTLTLFKDNISSEEEFIYSLKNRTYLALSYDEYISYDLEALFKK